MRGISGDSGFSDGDSDSDGFLGDGDSDSDGPFAVAFCDGDGFSGFGLPSGLFANSRRGSRMVLQSCRNTGTGCLPTMFAAVGKMPEVIKAGRSFKVSKGDFREVNASNTPD